MVLDRQNFRRLSYLLGFKEFRIVALGDKLTPMLPERVWSAFLKNVGIQRRVYQFEKYSLKGTSTPTKESL